ncbi:hypothetical protein QBC35DRAFT_498061 [Podospora australis]|uniref:Uncharacterized protein n=1 Tax=Podospora australis TaxID=1536484 RepID=A0AAN7AHR7_9PEZI|nr:hypothetical protein QBC35DRAFT_498061 [Podospora australis]
MGRAEDLPEVLAPPPPAPLPEYDTGMQVVSDHGSSHHRDIDSQRDKYPAQFDPTPKFPLDESQHSPISAESTYQQQWLDQQQQQNYLLAPGNHDGHYLPVSALSPANTSVPWSSIYPGGRDRDEEGYPYEDHRSHSHEKPVPALPEEKKICGIPRQIFVALVVFSLIVIAAAVGGGVGGALKARQGENNSGSSPAGADAGESSGTPTPSSSSPSPTKSKPPPKPTITSLFNETTIEDGFAFQAYSGVNGTGNRTQIYTEEGFFDFGFKARSYMWQPNNKACCITFCAASANASSTGKQHLGWWCDARRRNETPEAFPRINIWCGRWTNTENQKICVKPKPVLERRRRGWLYF